MDNEKLKKIAKISFLFSVIISAILVIYLIVGRFICGYPLYPWFGYFMGIAAFLFLPNIYLEVIEEEKREPRWINFFGRRNLIIFFIYGYLSILGALYIVFFR